MSSSDESPLSAAPASPLQAPAIGPVTLKSQYEYNAVDRVKPRDKSNFMVSLQVPEADEARCATTCNLMLDYSGSMTAASPKVQAALRWLLRGSGLDARDNFSISIFSSGVQAIMPVSQMTPENIEAALITLSTYEPSGETNLGAAIKVLASIPVDPLRPSLNIIITDGEPSTGDGPLEIIQTILGCPIDTDANGAGAEPSRLQVFSSAHRSGSPVADEMLASSAWLRPPIRRTYSMYMPANVSATQDDDDWPLGQVTSTMPLVSTYGMNQAELLIRKSPVGNRTQISVIGIEGCNHSLNEKIARAGHGIYKVLPAIINEVDLQVQLAEIVGSTISITHLNPTLEVIPAPGVIATAKFTMAMASGNLLKLSNLRSGESFSGLVQLTHAPELYKPGALLARIVFGPDEFELRLPYAESTDPDPVQEVCWAMQSGGFLDRIGDAISLSDNKNSSARKDALNAIRKDIEENLWNELIEVQETLSLIDKVISDTSDKLYGTLSMGRQSSSYRPTKVARTMSYRASQST